MTVFYPNTQGLVVHSIISLIKLLAEDLLSLKVLTKSIVLLLLLKNCDELLHCNSFS